MKKNIIIGAAMLIIGAVTGWLCRNHFRDEVKMMQIDSVVFRDTIREYKPVEIRKEVIDTMLIVIRDTIKIKEISYVSVPLERKMYASSEYYAEISGYRPSLDYIEVYPKTTIITERIASEKVRKNEVSIGIEAGFSSTLLAPVQLEYSRSVLPWLSVYGYAEYELFHKQFGIGAGTKVQLAW